MINILLVDDEEACRKSILYLAEFEKRSSVNVFEAVDGYEAKIFLAKHSIDIILTDICMPTFNGVSLMDWVHKHYPSIKIVVISGYQNFDYILQSMRNGAVDYLLKPIDPSRLNVILDKLIPEIISSKNAQLELKNEENNFFELKEYVTKNYDKPYSLNVLSQRFGYNPSYMSRHFKEMFGTGLVDYINDIRIKKASEILQATNMKIAEITKSVGFSDEKYFSRVFSKKMKMSPTSYRLIKRSFE